MTQRAPPIASINTVEVHWLRLVGAAILLSGLVAVASEPAVAWLTDGPWLWFLPLPLMWATYRAGVYRLRVDVYADGVAVRGHPGVRWGRERWIPRAEITRVWTTTDLDSGHSLWIRTSSGDVRVFDRDVSPSEFQAFVAAVESSASPAAIADHW